MDNMTNFITNKFVKLIEENHQQIIEQYMNDLLKNEKTTAYRALDRQLIYEIGDRVYRELSQWLAKGLPKQDIEMFYEKLGKMRLKQGVPASQIFHALVLLKRHMWLFIYQKLEHDTKDYKQIIDLINRVLLFFDRATYHMLLGYERELVKKW